MDINECVSYISQTVSNLTMLSDEKKQYYSDMLKNIDRRINDPFLNLAIIGDFSTGKSTFINALIRKDLLKTAWRATTAVPTHIYSISDGTIDVYADISEDETYDMSSENDRRCLEKKLGCTLPEEPKELITLLTTTNDFTELIERVRVYCPSIPIRKAFKDICIIDTPGVNPGAAGTKSHVAASRKVLREYADATVVLFQAQNVYTNSFKQFLAENVTRFLDDAVFVITMMDIVEEDSRDEIIDFVKQCLKESFGLSSPLVFGCCAKSVFSGYVNDEDMRWDRKFEALRIALAHYINGRREYIIKRQISFLLRQLIEVLDTDVQADITRITEELEVLERNSIENLKIELSENKINYTKQINDYIESTDFESIYNEMFADIVYYATRGINSCEKIRGNDYDAISYYMVNGVPNVVERRQAEFSRKLNRMFKPVNDQLQEYIDINNEVFMKYSVNINQVQSSMDSGGEMIVYGEDMGKISYDGGNFLTAFAEVTGAIMLLPVAIVDGFLGTDIAEAIGEKLDSALGGLINFFADINAKKTEAIVKVRNSAEAAMAGNRDKFNEQLELWRKNVLNTLDDIVKKFSDEYEKIYTERNNEFLAEKAVLENEIKSNREIHQRLTEYLLQI